MAEQPSEPRPLVVGVIADPSPAPIEVAYQLAEDLPGVLSEQLVPDRWQVDVHRDQLPSSDSRHTAMMDVASARMQEHGWDVAVCLTDLPLRDGKQPIVADLSNSRRVVVLSLPAFGAMALRRRVRGVVAQLIADLRGRGAPSDHSEEHRKRRPASLAHQFRRITPNQDGVDARVLASRGGVRLLIGMVRDNRPWRLVYGLTGPLVGAFAFSAFYLISTTVWQLAATMTAVQLVAAVLGSVMIMVGWLIVYHHLWEDTTGRPAQEREQALLFNASTVLTLVIGVGCMYVALYAINLLAAVVVLTPEVFGQYVGPNLGVGAYAIVILLVTAAATVAGAVGSGFESEDSIREAAYSYRERERRQVLRDTQRGREEAESGGDHQN
ncbi:hypothetical protein [Pseudonocardia parietis]|uniref:Membrane protein n=1 Tax=Pseudonocardia parietis TaxID=570936 RepID=A0ABS4VS64_9PSEU|nr:hypothetical protein [Pseudonocardia parietis]MBP2366772.1 putative membrane protein [Pseudonocardia parietis]